MVQGDDDQKAEMEERVNAFDPVAWLANKPTTLMEVAAKNKEKQTIHEKASLYNIYEGIPHARQLTETVDEFLKRLPPATTDVSTSMPWIYISNPYTPRPNKQNKDDDDDKFYDREEDEDGDIEMPEAIPLHDEEKDDVSKLIILGTNLMSEFETERFMLRKDMQGKPTGKLDAAIAKSRDEMVKRLKEYAVEYKCVTGKVGLVPTSPSLFLILVVHELLPCGAGYPKSLLNQTSGSSSTISLKSTMSGPSSPTKQRPTTSVSLRKSRHETPNKRISATRA